MANRWIKWIAALLLLLGGGVLFYEKVYLPKSTYRAVSLQKGDLEIRRFGIATVDAKFRFRASSVSGGKILSIETDQGEWVKKGQVVARLDPVDLPQQRKQLEASLERAKLEAEASRRELPSLEAQKEMAQINFRRYEKLREQNYAAQVEYDKARTDLQSLEAQIAASKARIQAAEAAIRQAQAALEAIDVKIANLTVRATEGGYVVSRDAKVGETIAAQQPIVTIVRPRDVWVRTTIDERISGDIRLGNPAGIVLRSRSDETLPGRVARIEALSDPVTEERIVDVAFEKVPEPFYLNEQAQVSITTGRLKDVLLLPAKLIRHGGVWTYRNGEAHFVKVEILGRDGEKVAVRGLEQSAKVLVPDPHKKPLFEGADIRL
ncbi:efflux RND transporter periplasmic adaptor subunit [Nitratifractor sp.]